MTAVVVGVLCALAVWGLLPPGRRVPTTTGPVAPGPAAVASSGAAPRRWLWTAAAGIGAWAFVGGPVGPAAGLVAAVVVGTLLGRVESPAQRRHRHRVRADLPHVVGLLGSAVRGGLAPADGLALVCAGPARSGDRRAGLGAPEGRPRHGSGRPCGRRSQDDPSLAPLGRTLARSARTGEPVADALDRLGAELAARARADIEDLARRVGVRAAVPLGVCLLPAFLLLGIVPVVAGLVTALLG